MRHISPILHLKAYSLVMLTPASITRSPSEALSTCIFTKTKESINPFYAIPPFSRRHFPLYINTIYDPHYKINNDPPYPLLSKQRKPLDHEPQSSASWYYDAWGLL
ncbi:hypothetical protein AVEN_68212-1 [Araneus ventricosus]|uniref:Uncharacterized protein n=1 Tax=Araneus ventricosus TaxID=182803 RepID=A0A4Y2PAM5_ARAVE|nr:hypothetical protein AVEN_68212-1 [Araneus ventricosus]